MGASVFSLCYFNSSNYRSLFSTCFRCRYAKPRPLHNNIACTSLRQGEELTETYRNNMLRHKHSIDVNSVVIFRHCFTGKGKVSYMHVLVTISDCFPNKTI